MRWPLAPFGKLDISFDVSGLKSFLESCDMWGEFPQRCLGDSPHRHVEDIWVRYKDPAEHIESGDWSGMADEHEAVWLKDIAEIKDISSRLMEFLGGSELGGVLLTKLPAGKQVYPHTDKGWHAEHYDKYYVPIKNESGAKFCFDYGDIDPTEGEVYAFRNDVNHWVDNDSESDRIAMVICIRQDKLDRGGACLGQQQQQ